MRDQLTNKLVSLNNGPTVTLTYHYDVSGSLSNIRSSATGGVNLAHHYDDLVEESTVVGTTTNLTVYTHGQSLISQRQGSTVYFFGTDGHGSTRFLTDTSGASVNTFAYDAYGTLISSNASPQTAYYIVASSLMLI